MAVRATGPDLRTARVRQAPARQSSGLAPGEALWAHAAISVPSPASGSTIRRSLFFAGVTGPYTLLLVPESATSRPFPALPVGGRAVPLLRS